MSDATVKMVRALEFYAEPSHWQSPSTGIAAQYDPEPSPVQKDGGLRAREALTEGVRDER
jgi:hypothetical protein